MVFKNIRRTSHGGFKAYHQDTGLLFQFILSEYSAAHQELNALNGIFKNKGDHSICYDLIAVSLEKLAGTVHDYMRLFSLGNNDGILTKLKNNCAYFSQTADIPTKEAMRVHRHADEAWLLCLESLNVLHMAKDEQNVDEAIHLNIKQSIDHLIHLQDDIKHVLPHFRCDENVIYFLLRHKHQLNLLFYPEFVTNILHQMYPEGLTSLTDFLTERYMSRGFTDLIPSITKEIAELEQRP